MLVSPEPPSQRSIPVIGSTSLPVTGMPFLHAYAGGYSKGGGNGGEYGDYDVEDFSPDALVFHFDFCFYD